MNYGNRDFYDTSMQLHVESTKNDNKDKDDDKKNDSKKDKK